MSTINMGGTSSIHPQANASPQNPASLPSPPITEARVKFEATRFDDQASQASSPSLASTMAGPSRDDQPSGEELQAIPKSKLKESISDYAHIFDELQIKPQHHDEVITGILHPIRAKRIKNLKTATGPMIRDLSSTFIRGYGNILYKKNPEKWLIGDSELQSARKTRIQFTPGDMRIDGPNAHFYTILEPMWWIMRGIIFALKPAPKRRGHPPKKKKVEVEDGEVVWQGDVDTEMDMQDLPHKERGGVAARPRGRLPKAGTQAGAQVGTGWDAAKAKAAKKPKFRFEEKQQKILERIEQEIDLSERNRGMKEKWSMTVEETDEAVQELIARLHMIRCKSEPQAFARSWEMNLARLDEIETIGDLMVGKLVELEDGSPGQSLANRSSGLENTPFKKVKLSGTASPQKATADSQIPSRPATPSGTVPSGAVFSACGEPDPPRTFSISNLANEPFNTTGPPSILNRLTLGQAPLIPSSISIYISTNPPLSPYHNNAYHWPGAPIGIADCKRLFDGIDQRVNIVKINGYTLSYGWDDVMRAIEATEQGRRHGFGVLLRDVSEAARMGVTRFRVKVLVRGMAPVYQGRV